MKKISAKTTSINVKFRPSIIAGHEGFIYYQIIHERKPRQLLTDYRIYAAEWDEGQSNVIITRPGGREARLLSIREGICRDVERLNKIIRKFDSTGIPYTAQDVIAEFRHYTKECSLFNCMERLIIKLRDNGRIRTSETYAATLSSFRKFRHGEDIMLDCLTSEVMESYEAWHQQRGVVPNTISFYTRILRAVYNRTVESGIIENRYPFRRVYTGIDKTVKRALPLAAIRKIYSLDLSTTPVLDYARDMFMLSFMLRGMSFIDMAYLRKSDLRNGHVTYRRRKTGQRLTIEWTEEMQRILDKYPENSSDYLLPIIRKKGLKERCTYKNVGYNINHNLKRIAEKAGIPISLTLYVARHSWASIARSKGIPISVISEGMGHDNETTTQIYLASLDTSVVDRANSLILASL
ncbi:MAG: site-specific integrase [Muribaculaceae bacterium]|nr:site-specific integrase [Muribaculaceae bacterium]